MDIKPGKEGRYWNKAVVRFDDADELLRFGDAAPFFSVEGQRYFAHAARGLWPGPAYPEKFPAQFEVSEIVLARTAGNLMLEGALAQGSVPSEVGSHVAKTIIDYFTRPVR